MASLFGTSSLCWPALYCCDKISDINTLKEVCLAQGFRGFCSFSVPYIISRFMARQTHGGKPMVERSFSPYEGQEIEGEEGLDSNVPFKNRSPVGDLIPPTGLWLLPPSSSTSCKQVKGPTP